MFPSSGVKTNCNWIKVYLNLLNFQSVLFIKRIDIIYDIYMHSFIKCEFVVQNEFCTTNMYADTLFFPVAT